MTTSDAGVVGFIGLGVMGKPMAQHVLNRGYTVVACNRSRPSLEELAHAGASTAVSPADVARRADVVITMLPDSADVERAILDEDGVLSTLRAGSTVVDMSSISPAVTRSIAARISRAGSVMLDAPVSGGEIGALNASLSIMVGGQAAALERARPILECMGSRIIHVGEEAGQGQLCKICNQIAIGGALMGVGEALALAKKAGVDPVKVREALLGGFAASRVLEVHGERLIRATFEPGFRTRLYRKDLRLAREAADAYDVSLPVTQVVTEFADVLMSRGDGELDYSAIGMVLFERAGLRQKLD